MISEAVMGGRQRQRTRGNGGRYASTLVVHISIHTYIYMGLSMGPTYFPPGDVEPGSWSWVLKQAFVRKGEGKGPGLPV